MNPPPGPGYEVSVSAAVRELLVRLHDQATAAGRRAEFLVALRTITARLRAEPRTFGEEVFDLPALRLTVKVAVVLPLAVEFAVHPDRPVVFVRTFRYLPPG